VLNCDNLFTIPKQAIGRYRGELDPESLEGLRTALMIALDLERP
jgi:mRNA-degrading endonuclease toxin of MazEF toxin-antitoxin module